MNKRQLTDWLNVMRDPESGKATGELEDATNPSERCCLGHLAYSMESDRRRNNIGPSVEYFYPGSASWSTTYLPVSLAKELDMDKIGSFIKPITVDGIVKFNGAITEFNSMSELNDDTDLTSAQIADIIEEQWEAGNIGPFNDMDPIFVDIASK